MPNRLKDQKIVGLTVTVAVTTLISSSLIAPAFAESLSTLKASKLAIPTTNNISELDDRIGKPIFVGGIAAIGLTAIGFATALLSGKNKEQLEVQLKTAQAIANVTKATKHPQLLNSTQPDDETDQHKVVDVAVAELIQNYHTQALAQAASQFWFSLTAATFGFLLILYAGISSLKDKELLALVNAIPGLTIEAVAVMFLKQAEDTRKRATELYDRLRSDDKQVQAITVIESIENQELRDVVKAKWALQIVGLQSQTDKIDSYPQPPYPDPQPPYPNPQPPYPNPQPPYPNPQPPYPNPQPPYPNPQPPYPDPQPRCPDPQPPYPDPQPPYSNTGVYQDRHQHNR